AVSTTALMQECGVGHTIPFRESTIFFPRAVFCLTWGLSEGRVSLSGETAGTSATRHHRALLAQRACLTQRARNCDVAATAAAPHQRTLSPCKLAIGKRRAVAGQNRVCARRLARGAPAPSRAICRNSPQGAWCQRACIG